jgi:hypothetical protein
MSCATSPWRLNCVEWRIIFADLQYELASCLPSGARNFEVTEISEDICAPQAYALLYVQSVLYVCMCINVCFINY